MVCFFRVLAVFGVMALLVVPDADAQTVRDKVNDHVDDNLDKRKGRGKKARRRGRGRRGRGNARGGSGRRGGAVDDPNVQGEPVELDLTDPALAAGREKLPRRIFPKYLQLNIFADTAYRGWLPQQYPSADVDVASYATWSVGLKGRFFKKIALYRGYYESNGLHTPRNKDASVAVQAGKVSRAAAKALAQIGFEFFRSWQPLVRYQAESFSTKATPKVPVCIVQRSDSGDLMDCPRSMDSLRVISSFETLVAGVRVSPQAESRTFFATPKGKLPPFYAGLGLMSYNKPYQVTIDGNTLEEFLFDGRFRGLGLALGTSLGGGPGRMFATIDMQVGLGEVSLTNDLTLNEVASDDWRIGYIQGNVHGGYQFVIVKGPPTIYFTPSISAGGASFHFINTQGEDSDNSGSPNLNWDFLWSARAAIEIAL